MNPFDDDDNYEDIGTENFEVLSEPQVSTLPAEVYNTPIPISDPHPEIPMKELQAIDLQIMNQVINKVAHTWKAAFDVKDVADLTKATITAIKARRDVLGLEYGHTSTPNKGPGIIEPLS